MKICIWTLLVYVLVSQSTKCYSIHLNAGSPSVAVMADWGGIPYYPYVSPYQLTLARSLAHLAESHAIKAILGLGDNFYLSGVKSVHDQRFKSTFENVFSAEVLKRLPWYFVAGNHDWRGNVSAQIAYSSYSNRWKFPAFFYKLNMILSGRCAAFVMIDTTVLIESLKGRDLLPPKISTKPEDNRYLQWIDDQLNSLKGCEYVFVAGHHPVWSIGHHGPTPELQRWLDPLLIKHRVSAYLSGHDHDLQHIRINGINYIVSGAGSVVNPSTRNKFRLPEGSVKFCWNQFVHLDAAYALISFEHDHANVTFIEATQADKLTYQFPLLPRV